jgi:hypothetical protein
VIRYLGRYTHRVGISNQRLVSMDDHGITFRTRNGNAVTLPPDVFSLAFLQQVLPDGFVKIRHYGLMASSKATTKLEIARARLIVAKPTCAAPAPPADNEGFETVLMELTGLDLRRCPVCDELAMVRRPLPDPHIRAPPVAA